MTTPTTEVDPTPLDMNIIRDELMWAITDAIENHPRSQQVRIGPSEVGIECARRIGYKLLQTPEVNKRGPAWKPAIGTAVHSWLEEVFTGLNAKLGFKDRWLLEQTVDVGEILGETITGHCDVYDSVTFCVVDWKVVGGQQLLKYKEQGPGQQYRAQAHLYGRGWQRQGRRVDTVAVMFLPRDRELEKAHLWWEPYNEQVALDALTRVEGITKLIRSAGPNALALLPTANVWCQFCPHYLPASTDIPAACPGHAAAGHNPA